MNMEFVYTNYLNTSTMLGVSSGTDSVAYLFDRKTATQYQTSGMTGVSCNITITLPNTISIDHLILQNINLKQFKVYYNNTTTNLFTLTSAATSVSEWSNNSETSLYLYFPTTNVLTCHIQMDNTIVANEEKKVGEIWITKKYLQFDYNPDYKEYQPQLTKKEYVHEMSDGGWVIYSIQNNYQASIKMDYVSYSQTSLLKNLYDEYSAFVFVPFPTGTGWTGELEKIYEVNWSGVWNFDKLSFNTRDLGYNGTIALRETPK